MSCSISVVIATYNREEPLRDTINDVRTQSISPTDVQIVDHSNEHEPETERLLDDLPNYFTHSRLDYGGLCEARNHGLENAKGDIIVYIDDDVCLTDNYLEAHRDAYSDPKVGGVAGQVLTPQIPDTTDEPPIGYFTWYGRPVTRLNSDMSGTVKMGRGCNMSFRRSLLEQIGGFDTTLDFRDEADAFSRVHKSGYKIRFEPEASLYHRTTESGGTRYGSQLSRKEIVAASKNKTYYHCKHNSIMTLAFALLSSIGYRIASNPDVHTIHLNVSAVLTGALEGFREWTTSRE